MLKSFFIFTLIIACLSQISFATCQRHIDHNVTISEEWRNNDINKYLSVNGDFNGDYREDTAQIKISENCEKLILIAMLNIGENKFEHYLLTDKIDINYKDVMGIKLIRAGAYQTACGKGYFDCYDNNSSTINIKYDSIELFKYEGVSSIFFWDKKPMNLNKFGLVIDNSINNIYYGNIIHDTNPTLDIPFGFADGLYDKDTKLIKFESCYQNICFKSNIADKRQ
ncbi:MAG: hypothetical protein LBL65_01490 [Campylobacteraceae bacterium]|jgi:hypothetical protein|nr:hypothetical protein [Campylobacteraceae bacterium]